MLILTISTDPGICLPITAALGDAACRRVPALPADAAGLLREARPDAVLLDAAGTAEPLEAVRLLRRIAGAPPVFVLCAAADRDLGLAAVREGAEDFLLRPLAAEDLALRLRRQQELERLRRESSALRQQLDQEAARGTLVAESGPMRTLKEEAAVLARTPEPLLILGESGVGKRTLAQFIHRVGPRGTLPAPLVTASALRRGVQEAPPWHAAAAAGTMVVDLAGSAPRELLELVTPLLAAGRSATPFRLIVTAEKGLNGELPETGPLADMHRHALVVPPLRERPADIPALLAHFAQRAARRLGRPVSVSPRALAMLAVYPWPGNVAELEGAIERAAALGGGRSLEFGDFGFLPSVNTPGEAERGMLSLKGQVEVVERQVIEQALQAARGNRRAAARLLGVSLRTLFYKLKRYGL